MNKHLRQLGRGFGNLAILAVVVAAIVGFIVGVVWLASHYAVFFFIPLGIILLLITAYGMGDDSDLNSTSSTVPWEDEDVS